MKKVISFVSPVLLVIILLVSAVSFNVQAQTVASPQMSICQFINLLNTVGIISNDRANTARASFNCSANPINTGLIPAVDIKVAGYDGPVNVSVPGNINISWTSSNVTACANPVTGTAKALSGTQSVYVDSSQSVGITCTGPYGTVTDSVMVNLPSTYSSANSGSSLELSCSPSESSVNIGDSVTWVANVSGGTGSYAYSWSGDVSGNSRNVSKTYSSNGTKSVKVRVTSGSSSALASCTARVGQNSNGSATDSSSLKVYCFPSASSVNLGDYVTWTAVPAGGEGNSAYTYSWTGDEGVSSNNQIFYETYTTPGAKSVTINVTSGSLTASNVCNATVINSTTANSANSQNSSNYQNSSANPYSSYQASRSNNPYSSYSQNPYSGSWSNGQSANSGTPSPFTMVPNPSQALQMASFFTSLKNTIAAKKAVSTRLTESMTDSLEGLVASKEVCIIQYYPKQIEDKSKYIMTLTSCTTKGSAPISLEVDVALANSINVNQSLLGPATVIKSKCINTSIKGIVKKPTSQLTPGPACSATSSLSDDSDTDTENLDESSEDGSVDEYNESSDSDNFTIKTDNSDDDEYVDDESSEDGSVDEYNESFSSTAQNTTTVAPAKKTVYTNPGPDATSNGYNQQGLGTTYLQGGWGTIIVNDVKSLW